MSKKVISILLSAAMLVAMLCVGVGAVTASADDTVTYYFLAPDDYFATNDSVGFYYWAPTENAPWPGLEMTPAPEVGKNVFKCECPDMDSTSTIIFNAFVDAGTPADPELAAVAHQTININTEGYMEGESEVYDSLGMELDDFYGMIYVLDNNNKSINDFSGAATTVGEWFSLDASAPNYYKNFEQYYGSYGFTDEDTDTDVASDTDVEPSEKQYHAGDVVEVSYNVGNLPNATAITASVYFNPEVLEHVEGDYVMPALQGSFVVNDSQVPAEAVSYKGAGDVRVVNTYNIDGKEMNFAGDPTPVITYKFTAKQDFNPEDMQLSFMTYELCNMIGTDDNLVFSNYDWDPQVELQNTYSTLTYNITCGHPIAPDTDTATDTATDSDKPVASDTDTATDSDKPVASDTDTTSKPSTDSDKTTDSDKKNTNDNASKTSSKTSTTSKTTTTTNNAATVQTAGTFAVVSLVVILMAAAAVVLYTRKKTEE